MTNPPSQEAASSEERVKHLSWWDSPELLLSPPVLIVFVSGIDGAIGSLSLHFFFPTEHQSGKQSVN